MDDRNRKKGKFKLLNLKKDYIVTVPNVRTIRRKVSKKNLCNFSLNIRLDILGIVEHKIIHDDPIEHHEKQNVTFTTTSATKNANSAPIGGLGLLINRTSAAALAEIKPYNSGILAAHCNGSPATTINIYYAPAEGTTETINNYEHLIDIIRTVPKHDVLLVIGDYNAYLGLHDALYAFHDRTNNNGKLLLNYSPEPI